MDYVYYAVDYSDSLAHHGIKGQKWGLRRFQNPDGTWTNAGKARRNKGAGQVLREVRLKSSKRAYNRAITNQANSSRAAAQNEQAEREWAAKTAQSKADYTTAKANLDKHMNSLSTKLIGANSYKIKKYNKQMDEANRQYLQSEANRQQFEAAAKQYRSNEEIYSMKASAIQASIVKQGNKYADKYGDKALDELAIGIDFGRNKI